MGGNIVLLYAAAFDDVPCVVNISARFNMTVFAQKWSSQQLNHLENQGVFLPQ